MLAAFFGHSLKLKNCTCIICLLIMFPDSECIRTLYVYATGIMVDSTVCTVHAVSQVRSL